MLKEASSTRFYRFGEYEVDAGRRLLFRNGERVRLTPKAFDVLILLVERHPATVSKDELLRVVWPDTSVEEISLTRNISVLRKTLGEKRDEHHYIVTVPGTGYRFVAAVERGDAPAGSPVPRPRARTIWPFLAAAILLAIALMTWYFRPPGEPQVWRAIPLTSYPGFEHNPALSPAGNQVAFTWDGEQHDNFDIYVKTLRAGAPRRLTTHPADDLSPAWSPDGSTIAFVRRLSADRGALIQVPAIGGAERKVTDVAGKSLGLPANSARSVAWSPDGRYLVVSHSEPVDSIKGLFLVSVQTGEKRRLTEPAKGLHGDYMPTFSPDGATLAFVRFSGSGAGEICLLPLRQDFSAAEQPRRLTSDGKVSASPAWTRDGRHIVYVYALASQEAPRELRRIAVSGSHSAERVHLLDEELSEISLGRHLVYSRRSEDTNIWRTEINRPGDPPAVPYRLIASTRREGLPRYSPDGRKIAFGSNRSGTREIWIAEADGSNPTQMTSFGGPHLGVLAWSPDSRKVVFHARVEGQADLFSVPVTGGAAKRLTSHPTDDLSPSYSQDGRWIYFSSTRSGRLSIWKMPAEGGDAIEVTRSEGGYMQMESPDGKTLYYCHQLPQKGIWKMPVEGGEAVQVTGPYRGPLCGLTVTRDGLYYTAPTSRRNQYAIDYFSFASGRSHPVVITDRMAGSLSLSVSPDNRFLLYTQFDQQGSDLMLIENFQSR